MIYAICKCVMPVEYEEKLYGVKFCCKGFCSSCGGYIKKIDTKSSVSKHSKKDVNKVKNFLPKPAKSKSMQKSANLGKPTHYIACLSLKCAKAGRHVKGCVAYGENYPVNFIASKVKNKKTVISYYDENWSTIKRFDDSLIKSIREQELKIGMRNAYTENQEAKRTFDELNNKRFDDEIFEIG